MKIQILQKDSSKSFSFLTGLNRAIIPAQVTKLAESINKMGIIRPVVVAKISFITGKPLLYVIDGQHLFHACLRNNLDIPYVIITVKDNQDLVEKIALLNASSKSWGMIDYITAWKSVNPSYISLEKYFNTYDLEIAQVAEILMKGTAHGGSMAKVIKAGRFVINNEDKALCLINYITDVLNIVPRMDRSANRWFITTYINMVKEHKNYNHAKFLIFLKNNKEKLLFITQDIEKLYQFLLTGIK